MLAYGYITAYANPQLITGRIEISITNPLRVIIGKARSITTKVRNFFFFFVSWGIFFFFNNNGKFAEFLFYRHFFF